MHTSNKNALTPANKQSSTSLSGRVNRITIIASGAALLFFFTFFISYDRYLFKQTLISNLDILAKVSALNSAGALTFRDKLAAANILQTLDVHKNIQRAVITDETTQIFVEYLNQWQQIGKLKVIPHNVILADGYVEISHPIGSDSNIIGHLYIAADLDAVNVRSLRILMIGTAVFVLAILLALLLSRNLIQGVVGPIEQIRRFLDRVRTGGNYRIRADDPKIKELQPLVGGLNDLLDAVANGELAVRASEKRLSLALWGSGDGMWDWSVDEGISRFDENSCNIMQQKDNKLSISNRQWIKRIHIDDRRRVVNYVKHFLTTSGYLYQLECRIPTQDHYIWIRLKGRISEVNKQGAALRVTGTLSDISDSKKVADELQFMANFDHLTQLPNRSMFYSRLDHAIGMAQRNHTKVAVLFIDLDHFKQVNDIFGHAAGDDALKQAGQYLRSCIRGTDTVARFSGDEFVIILEGLLDNNKTQIVAKNIVDKFRQGIIINQQNSGIGVSIGISIFPLDSSDVSSLLSFADTAMYFAKKASGNNFKFYDTDLDAETKRSSLLERELKQALINQQLSVCYQPKLTAHQHQLVGFEALLRWTHPELGIVSPVEFIPVAEESGLIHDIGHWVLKQTCLQLKLWHDMGFSKVQAAVNVSAKQFQLSDFPLVVAQVLHDTGLAPQYLEIELTEQLVMEEPEKLILMLRAVNNLGVKIAIDDFGTGYSSLSYLRRFPIDVLKIDRSFVAEINPESEREVITDAIISMAHGLKLQVVAEGVETQAQLEYLQDRGCEMFQGYYFYPPLSVIEAEYLLQNPV